jgi:RNA polymerase sigma factor (sigma-70 family)
MPAITCKADVDGILRGTKPSDLPVQGTVGTAWQIELELDEEIETSVAHPADDPEAALQVKLRGVLLRRALSQLSSQHREIIDLVYYHEKSIAECAEILGIPAATVKTRMFYARKKLAELVNDI